MSETRKYQVLSPIKFGRVVYRRGTAELPERIGSELVRSGHLAELPSVTPVEAPKTPVATVTHHPESQPATLEAGSGDSRDAVTSKPAGGAPPAGADVRAAPKPAKASKAKKPAA